MAITRGFDLIENYIYIYQLDKYVILPVWPEEIKDSLGSKFAEDNILARTAPIYSYSHSGPRTVAVNLSLHRDLMYDINKNNQSFLDKNTDLSNRVVEIGDDYIDVLIKYLQAMVLPSYATNNINTKMINPPMVALRLGSEVFIKGVITSAITVSYQGPISSDRKYQQVVLGFDISEIDPQDAESIVKWGSFRGLETVLTRNLKGN